MFQLQSSFQPTGDQPDAIIKLVDGIKHNEKYQVLMGATGTGKTFTMANVIQEVNKPTIVMAHNKTLAAQLYGEFKQFFPNNAVEYFLSSFDFYLPESYDPVRNIYFEKDSKINQEIEKLRLSTVTSLQSGRQDIIVISTVSCIFGAGNPRYFQENIIQLNKGDQISRTELLKKLSSIGYIRAGEKFEASTYRVLGDQIDIYNPVLEQALRFYFFGDEIEEIHIFDPASGKLIQKEQYVRIFPAKLYTSDARSRDEVIAMMEQDLEKQYQDFLTRGLKVEAVRLKTRTEYDIEMFKELGYCFGIENYSRYLDRRQIGERPNCLLDYFPQDHLMFIDESHATIPQIHAMYGGNASMKRNLVDYGWRLAVALDNRPLKFNEFEDTLNQVIFVSATPGKYELNLTGGEVVEQVIRPTGLVDPIIEIKPTKNQIDYLLQQIQDTIAVKNRVLITTLTKKMSENLSEKLNSWNVKTVYLHSEVKPIDRIQILRQLRLGEVDVLVGVNLLREGLDLPEVGLVVIMDADKEGFLRSDTSIIQTMGRAARNVNGKVLMFADKITGSMQRAIDETERRRKIQIDYNKQHNITPKSIHKSINEIMLSTKVANQSKKQLELDLIQKKEVYLDPILANMSEKDLKFQIKMLKAEMTQAAKDLDFLNAAKIRDTIFKLEEKLKT